MIKIMSREDAINFISQNPTHPIIAIGESSGNSVESLTSIAENCLCLIFDDIELNHSYRTTVSEDHINSALQWAKDKPNIIVACRAGVSRSSALAYLIECTRKDPEKALDVLDTSIHQPNSLVIKVGSKLLDNYAIIENYHKWLSKLYNRYL